MSARSKLVLAVGATALLCVASPAQAQWVTTFETFYLQAPHNWTFRNNYENADRLFNAFDYGHAILYETLWTKPEADAARLEETIYNRLTKRVLVRPPNVPLEEVAIEPMYARLAPEAKAMFDWSHILHRQIYDVLADERIDAAGKDAEIARLLAYYRTRPDLAFSRKPKSMELMQEQSYSLAFRQKFPKFNGLIWGYHWFQVGLYEPLMVGKTGEERQAGVRRTVARFWQMLGDPPRTLPHQMPMTAAIAPAFAARYPEAAIIFDNLHSMHDVVSDILANPAVPRSAKRREIMRAAALFRDDSSYVMPVTGWLTMSREMGVENMGGPAVGFAVELPTPTVTYGAVMQHDRQTGAMTGMKVGQMVGMSHAGMNHAAAPAPAPAASGTGHEGHVMPTATPPRDTVAPAARAPEPASVADHTGHVMRPSPSGTGTGTGSVGVPGTAVAAPMSATLLQRMLRDPVIRRRITADSAFRRLLTDEIARQSETDQKELSRLLNSARP